MMATRPESTTAAHAEQAPRYRVSVVEEAVIVERGERRRKWFVRHQEEWLRVEDYPGAVLETLDDESARCPPGIVWQRSYEVVLSRGARLMAVSTFPRLRARSTLWYLNHGLATRELVYQQHQYTVAGNYRLVELGQMRQHIKNQVARDPSIDEDATPR